MPSFVVDLSTVSAAAAGLSYAVFAVRQARHSRLDLSTSRPSLWLVAALTTSAAWGAATAIQPYFDSMPAWIASLLDLARYGCWFAFLLQIGAPTPNAQRQGGLALLRPLAFLLILVGIASIVAGSALGIPSDVIARPALFESLALPVFGLILVEQLARNIAEDSRWNAKPLCLGLSVLFIFDVYAYSQAVLFGQMDTTAVSMRGAVHALAVPFLYIAARRHSDWTTRLRVSRVAAFHSTVLLLAGVYLLLVAAIGYYIRFFGGAWGSALQLVALFAGLAFLVTITLSGAVRSRLRVMVGKHFFRYRYDYREEWLRFTTRLSTKGSPTEMGTLVIRGIADLIESPSGALWLRDSDQAVFMQSARWNTAQFTAQEPADSAFAKFLIGTGWVIDLEEFRAQPHRYSSLVLPPWLANERRIWLVVPLIVGEELIGFVGLGPARAHVDLDWEVRDLLKTASRQAASFLAQMRATEALLEARKFDAFNRMSAFVVHDLKNIVTQLSLMVKNAQRLHSNPEFQADMLATVESSLEKMRQMMMQLRDGEAPSAGRSGVDLHAIAKRIEAMVQRQNRQIEVDAAEHVYTRGHEERIERVLGHIVQNALDATKSGDRVWLKLALVSGQVRVEIGDTGKGMSEEYVRTRLFKPFETTKEAGMGIGVYESAQYIKELGGSIDVDTAVNRGTVMTVRLPVFTNRTPSDLQLISAK